LTSGLRRKDTGPRRRDQGRAERGEPVVPAVVDATGRVHVYCTPYRSNA